jgi:general secretion pathway protein G
MLYTRKAFTMIELVFVIVVLGILASIAVSKMAVTRDDAQLVKGRSDVSAIRSAISLQRSKNMMRGMTNGGNPVHLDALSAATSNDGDKLFDYDSNSSNPKKKILDYPIYSKNANGSWRKVAVDTYAFRILNMDINFTYSNGNFDCNHNIKHCKTLTQ